MPSQSKISRRVSDKSKFPHAPKKPPKVCASCALMLFPQDDEDAKAKMH